jgi:hypothetical protein
MERLAKSGMILRSKLLTDAWATRSLALLSPRRLRNAIDPPPKVANQVFLKDQASGSTGAHDQRPGRKPF